MTNPPAPYEIIIAPRRGWLRIDWKEMWEYRDLLVLLVRRDFLSKYKQTLLGPAWFLLQPLLLSLMLALIFGRFAKVETDGIPPLLFYLCNMLGWNYFAQNVTAGSATFTANAHLFGKVYFPRLVVPVSIIISNAFAFLLSFVLFLGFLAYYLFFTAAGANISLSWNALWIPLLLIQTAAFSFGVSLWIAASTARYRDLTHATPLILQLWMFATVSVSLTTIPQQWQWIAWANPMLPVTEAFRLALLGRGHLPLELMGISVAITLLIFISGIFIFQKTERTVVDSL
jgi:lipopolysaccharide transport system permease protein